MAFLRGEATLDEGRDAVTNPVPFVDTFGELHPGEKTAGTYHGFRGDRVGRRVDYVFAGPGTQVLDARILHEDDGSGHVSDHYPVSAVIRLSPPR